MPIDWKSSDSKDRLLAAVIASMGANPKLNYNAIARFYGGGASYGAVWGRMAQVSGNAADLMVAVDLGQDPINIVLKDRAVQGGRKAKDKDISVRFGGISTQSAIDNRFRKVKVDAKSINKAVANGVDPFTLNIGDSLGSAAGDEIHQFYGSDAASPGAIRFQYSDRIRHHVQALRDARAAGIDCKHADLYSAVSNKEIAHYMGDHATPKAVNMYLSKVHKPFSKLQRAARELGDNPQFIELDGATKAPNDGTEIARLMGSDAAVNGIKYQFADRIRPLGRLLQDALASGKDPKDVDLNVSARSANVIAAHMGSDVNGGALEWQFRRLKKVAKEQARAVEAGVDPKNISVSINIKDIAQCLNDGTTAVALQHRFRSIRKEAATMRLAAAGDGNGSTPTAKTPRKRGPNKITGSSTKSKPANDNEGDDDEYFEEGTPSKKMKSGIKKTIGGRVTKAKAKGANGILKQDLDSEGEDTYYDSKDIKPFGGSFDDEFGTSYIDGTGYGQVTGNGEDYDDEDEA